MDVKRQLLLEVINGPLDGALITLEEETEWSRAGAGPLTFPWDDELGHPQARLKPEEEDWSLETFESAHGTYRINRDERVKGNIKLEMDDVIQASKTWLLVRGYKTLPK